MNTPSHFLMTAAFQQKFRQYPIATRAWLLGSVAPDVALFLLVFAAGLYYRRWLGWSTDATWRYVFGTLYFHHPLWMAAHNLLHSPLLLVSAVGGLWPYRCRQGSLRHWLFWFLLACLLHSVVDIFTHVNDGPLLLFPLEWTIRFHSPVSYWDSRHYGNEFALFELALDGALLGYLVIPRLWAWGRARQMATEIAEQE